MKRSATTRILAYTLIIFFIGFIAACGSDAPAPPVIPDLPTEPAPLPTPDDPEPTPPPTPDNPDPGPVTYNLILSDDSGVGFSNGTTYNHFMDGHVTHIAPGVFTVNDLIYQVNQYGAVISTTQLPAVPEAVAIAGGGADIWTFEHIPPVYAAANGGMYDDYTRIWLNYSESGLWVNNNWIATRAVSTASGDVIAYDTLNRRYTQTDTIQAHYAAQDGILIHTVDTVTRRGTVRTADGDYPVAWATNYFNGADEWLESGGAWYSWNGYIWSVADGLQEQASDLTAFINWTNPVVIAAGTRVDASLERTYWIEANTGWLWMYTPAMDTLEQSVRLYVADGERSTGNIHAAEMEPIIISASNTDTLYYTFEGAIWRYDFASGINGPFVAGKKVRRM